MMIRGSDPAFARSHSRQRARFVLALGSAVFAGWCAGCSSPARVADFNSPDPVERTLAAERAVAAGDMQAVPQLIGMLGSSDPAVRMIAQRSLERLTGLSHGFDHAGSELQRRAAIGRWVAWYESESGLVAAE